MHNGRAGMAFPRHGSHGFGDHAACACPGGAAERGTGCAQDARGQQDRIIKLQAAGLDGKGWHEERDLPGQDKRLINGNNFENNKNLSQADVVKPWLNNSLRPQCGSHLDYLILQLLEPLIQVAF